MRIFVIEIKTRMIMGMINCDDIIRMKSSDYENEAEDKIQSHSG